MTIAAQNTDTSVVSQSILGPTPLGIDTDTDQPRLDLLCPEMDVSRGEDLAPNSTKPVTTKAPALASPNQATPGDPASNELLLRVARLMVGFALPRLQQTVPPDSDHEWVSCH